MATVLPSEYGETAADGASQGQWCCHAGFSVPDVDIPPCGISIRCSGNPGDSPGVKLELPAPGGWNSANSNVLFEPPIIERLPV
jgi:hypothetical protein